MVSSLVCRTRRLTLATAAAGSGGEKTLYDYW